MLLSVSQWWWYHFVHFSSAVLCTCYMYVFSHHSYREHHNLLLWNTLRKRMVRGHLTKSQLLLWHPAAETERNPVVYGSAGLWKWNMRPVLILILVTVRAGHHHCWLLGLLLCLPLCLAYWSVVQLMSDTSSVCIQWPLPPLQWFFASYLYALALELKSVAMVNTLSSLSAVFVLLLSAIPLPRTTDRDRFNLTKLSIVIMRSALLQGLSWWSCDDHVMVLSVGGAVMVGMSQGSQSVNYGALFAVGGAALWVAVRCTIMYMLCISSVWYLFADMLAIWCYWASLCHIQTAWRYLCSLVG